MTRKRKIAGTSYKIPSGGGSGGGEINILELVTTTDDLTQEQISLLQSGDISIIHTNNAYFFRYGDYPFYMGNTLQFVTLINIDTAEVLSISKSNGRITRTSVYMVPSVEELDRQKTYVLKKKEDKNYPEWAEEV